MDQNLSPITPSSPQESSQKKTLLTILLVVIVVVSFLTAGYFWYKNKQTPILAENQNLIVASSTEEFTDWKTYKNEEYGFEIKYPPDWKSGYEISNLPKYWGKDVLFKISTTQKAPDPNFPLDSVVSFNVLPNLNNLSLQEVFNLEYKDCLKREEESTEIGSMGCRGPDDVSKWQNITIDGKEALRSGKVYEEGGPNYYIYIKLNKKFLILVGVPYNQEYDTEKTFNKMISNFKFITAQ